MSAEILYFDVFAASGRGLLARPIMPNNNVAFLADISAISYSIHNLTDAGPPPPVTGNLTPATVMFAALQTPWSPDKTGYSFKWPAPGTLWPDPTKQYRIVLTFTMTAGGAFILAYQANTKSPSS